MTEAAGLTVGACVNATLDDDGSVLVECPYGGRAPVYSVDIAQSRMTIRGMCEGCQRDAADREMEEELRRREERLRRSMVGSRMRDWTLETFPRDEAGLAALASGVAWLGGYRDAERRNLILWGDAGVGKTGLAWALVRELVMVDDVDAVLVNWRDLLAEMRQRVAQRRSGELELPEFRARHVPVLGLDDVGAERPTDFAREELAVLIEARYRNMLPTVMTSNYPPSSLAGRLGHDDVVIGQRLVSRLVEDAAVVHVLGPDRRV